jgi:ribonuclease HI
MKYLGVIIDRGLSWREHARHAARNVMTTAQKIRGIAGRTWGTEPKILREIFDGAIRPALMYGAEIWGEKAEDPIIRRHLRAAQRAFLLGVTRAYRTTSNVALEVLAGCTRPHLEAAARHANWRERGTAEFEGKAVFAEGPHPAEPERKWEELPAETIPGASFWTDASQGEGGTAIGIVKTEGGETRETRGLRLQDGYPTHMAELYALGIAIKSVAGQRGENFNFVTDSRVALDMLTKRKGGGNKSGTRATKEGRPTKSLERWTEDSEDGATGRSVS